MQKIDKQKEVVDYLSTIKDDDSAFVLYYFKKTQLLRNRFPEIKSFDDFVATFKKRIGQKRKDELQKLYEKEKFRQSVVNADGYVMNSMVPTALGVEKEVYKKFEKTDYFPYPVGMETFHKWGKTLQTPYFNYDDIISFKENKLEAVLSVMGLGKEKLEEYKALCEEINNSWNDGSKLYSSTTASKNIYDSLLIHHSVKLKDDVFKLSCIIPNPMTFKKYKSNKKSETKNLIEKALSDGKKIMQNWETKIHKEVSSGLYSFDDVISILKEFPSLSFQEIEKNYDVFLKNCLVKKEGAKLAKLFDLKNYQDTFPIAREIKRNVHIISGPTNSGKTYEAIEALKAAHSGVYLAPLRLMAMEIFDKLNAAGIPCSLKTGDDEVIIPGAKHIASTIECLDLSTHYEVAVIDEFQMLRDQERGWAWTQAILGVVANDVYLIGNSSGVNITEKILSKTKDVIDIKEKSRHSQLKIIDKPVHLNEIQSGDAIIVFSRKGVIEWAEYLRDQGRSVSLIYGALAPEVRRKQAQMFLDGETDILVSTDAIGMGLNLPIKRVLFTTMEKYNGYCMDYLTPTEIKQIAGRAGRYKEDGFVGVIKGGHSIEAYYDYFGEMVPREDKSFTYLRLLNTSLTEKDIPIVKLDVSPNNFHLREISKALNTNSILDVLDCFKYVVNDDIFCPRFISGAEDFVNACGKKFLSLNLELQYNLINTPVEDKNNILQRVACIIQETFFKKNKSVLEDWININNSSSQFIEIELKMLTALIHISKQTDLIDMSSANVVRKNMSARIIKELIYTFRQSAERKRLYQEKLEQLALKKARKIERKRLEKELLENEYRDLKAKRDALIPNPKLNLSEEEKDEFRKQRKSLNNMLKKLRLKMPNLANL